jgi:type VI secretion system protein ImpH
MRDSVELSRLLEDKIASMDFFQVLRLIENAYPDKPRIGQSLRPRDDMVRLGQDPSLIFHAAALGQFVPAGDALPARLVVNFFGLLGANGPMPIHFTEYVRDRMRNAGDSTLLAFLDMFHHRMLSLFYRARASAEPVIHLDRETEDRFADYVGSMCGIGAPGLRGRDGVSDFAKLHFAGLLANRARPASGLEAILVEFFKLPFRIEQFVGHWMQLPPDNHTRLGQFDGSNRLGISTIVGQKIWDGQSKFRIVIGPLDYADYQRMLPRGASMQRLRAWVHNYIGLALEWDVRLILKKEAAPALKLGGGIPLGWSSWLHSKELTRNPDQLLINPNAHKG